MEPPTTGFWEGGKRQVRKAQKRVPHASIRCGKRVMGAGFASLWRQSAMSNSETTPPYSVYYRRRDGAGTRLWESFDTLAEAFAQQNWCARNAATEATMVWILDAVGQMIGHAVMKEVTNAR